jgi:hypothetical protein
LRCLFLSHQFLMMMVRVVGRWCAVGEGLRRTPWPEMLLKIQLSLFSLIQKHGLLGLFCLNFFRQLVLALAQGGLALDVCRDRVR